MPPAVVLFGKVGHGKTTMMNKLCGSRFPAVMGAQSVTEHVQHGKMPSGVVVIDSPGFYSSRDVAGHVAAQKVALEGFALSGVYLVVEYGRADDIAELASTIMDVIGCDDIRIAITHEDVAAGENAFNPLELRRALSETLDIDEHKICSFGKTTPASVVRQFVDRTLHEPRNFKMSEQQMALVAALAVGSRKLNKNINSIFAKIVAAEVACREASTADRGYESDFLITATQHATTEMVRTAKEKLFKSIDAYSEEQQNLMYGKAGVSLTLRLQSFIETTNKLLSYDVTDTSNPQTVYKKCNYCGAVYNKTEGCDGGTICGAIPSAVSRDTVLVTPEFVEEAGHWTLLFRHGRDAVRRSAAATWNWFKQANPLRVTVSSKGGGSNHRKKEGATFESGCGQHIRWSSMLPVPPEELGNLKTVEKLQKEFSEECSKVQFENKVRMKELENKKILLGANN